MFRLWQTEHGKWKWEIRANNHVVMLSSSQAHPTHTAAQAQIKAVSNWARTKYKPMNSIKYMLRYPNNDTTLRHQFLVIENGKVLGKSKDYKGKLQCNKGSILTVELCKSRETLLVTK